MYALIIENNEAFYLGPWKYHCDREGWLAERARKRPDAQVVLMSEAPAGVAHRSHADDRKDWGSIKPEHNKLNPRQIVEAFNGAGKESHYHKLDRCYRYVIPQDGIQKGTTKVTGIDVKFFFPPLAQYVTVRFSVEKAIATICQAPGLYEPVFFYWHSRPDVESEWSEERRTYASVKWERSDGRIIIKSGANADSDLFRQCGPGDLEARPEQCYLASGNALIRTDENYQYTITSPRVNV